MDKFEKRAADLLSQTKNCLTSFAKVEGGFFGSHYALPPEKDIYDELLLDVKILFHEFDPSMPLNNEIMRLAPGHSELVTSSEPYQYEALKRLLDKFLALLKFRREPLS